MHWCRPVDDPFGVEEHESRRDLGRVETSSALLELPGLLNVEHQIASVHKLHHKEEAVLQWGGRRGHDTCASALKLPTYREDDPPSPQTPMFLEKSGSASASRSRRG